MQIDMFGDNDMFTGASDDLALAYADDLTLAYAHSLHNVRDL